jgi:hypothetical protein
MNFSFTFDAPWAAPPAHGARLFAAPVRERFQIFNRNFPKLESAATCTKQSTALIPNRNKIEFYRSLALPPGLLTLSRGGRA